MKSLRSLTPLPLAAALIAFIPSASGAAEMPRVSLEPLERAHPGWTWTEQGGDARSGMVAAERAVWSMFYLHWFPVEKIGGSLSAGEAEKLVAGLWEGLTIDEPLKAAKISLPAHEGYEISAATAHGEMKNRYYVWACPDSGRVFVAEAIVNVTINAPPILSDWMRDMARTVECHGEAAAEKHSELERRYEVPGGGVAYSMPPLWSPIPGYRVQKTFGGSDFAATHPAITVKEGQDLAVPSDALLRLFVTWRPAPEDFAMTYDVLQHETEDFWRARSGNLMIDEMRAVRDIWIVDGRIRPNPTGATVPPTRQHKIRGWLWRKDGTLYLAFGTIGAVHFGRRFPGQKVETWDRVLEGMFQSIVY